MTTISITIPAGYHGDIICMSNTSCYQRITLTWPNNNQVVFQGSGEGKSMKMLDGEYSHHLISSDESYKIEVAFEYSTLVPIPNKPFKQATAQPQDTTRNGPFMIISVKSKVDANDNGSLLIITLISDNEKEYFQNTRFIPIDKSGPDLTLHAKVYYDFMSEGDEIYVSIIYQGNDGPADVRGAMIWQNAKGIYQIQDTPLGGYLIVVAVFRDPRGDIGIEPNALLELTTTISYWASKPTGYKGTDWKAYLGNSSHKITRVTR